MIKKVHVFCFSLEELLQLRPKIPAEGGTFGVYNPYNNVLIPKTELTIIKNLQDKYRKLVKEQDAIALSDEERLTALLALLDGKFEYSPQLERLRTATPQVLRRFINEFIIYPYNRIRSGNNNIGIPANDTEDAQGNIIMIGYNKLNELINIIRTDVAPIFPFLKFMNEILDYDDQNKMTRRYLFIELFNEIFN